MNDDKPTIKIISYNIHSGKNIWMMPRFHEIIRYLKKEDADMIGIQEIHENQRYGRQVTALKKALDMDVHYGPSLSIDDGQYGIASFSKYPIIHRNQVFLPTYKEPRSLIDSQLQIYHDQQIHLLNTHLSLHKKTRKKQLNHIKAYLESLRVPFILMGDFNTPFLKLHEIFLTDAAIPLKKEHLSTMMLSKKRIDYIFVSDHFHVINYQIHPVRMSDHYPVVVEVTFSN